MAICRRVQWGVVSEDGCDLKAVLERLYGQYNRYELIEPDPLQFVYRFSDREDMEVVAFLAAALAYGRVQQIERSLVDLFGRVGERPYKFVAGFDDARRGRLTGFKHRFTTGQDIADLLELLRWVLSEHGSIESYFVLSYNQRDTNVVPALAAFCDSLLERHGRSANQGLKYLLASPSRGSACKRLNLFLRWMVRDDAVDTGLWKRVDPAKLIVPIDVHMARLCRILRLTAKKSTSLSTAIEITESFGQIEPADPAKYDFALSRIGIVDDCTGRYRAACELCELFRYCLRRENWRHESKGS